MPLFVWIFVESWEEINPCAGSPRDWVLGEFTPGSDGGGVDWEVDALVGNVGDGVALEDGISAASEEGVCWELSTRRVGCSFLGRFLEADIFPFPLSLSDICN